MNNNSYTFSPTFIRQSRWSMLLGLQLFGAFILPFAHFLAYPAVYLAGAGEWQNIWTWLLGLNLFSGTIFYIGTTKWVQKKITLEDNQLVTNLSTGMFIWQSLTVTIPYHELKRVALTRNRAGQLIHLSLQGGQRTLQFWGLERFDELGQRLATAAPAEVVTEKRVWLNVNSPFGMLVMPLLFGLGFLVARFPYIILLPVALLLSAPIFLIIYQPLRHLFGLKTAAVDLVATILGLSFTAYLLYAMFNSISEQFPTPSCPWVWQQPSQTECVAVYSIGGDGLAFSADGQNLLLNSPYLYNGVWVQPLDGWWPYFEATFIPLSNTTTTQYRYSSSNSYVIFPAQAQHRFLVYSGRENVLSTVNTVSGTVEQEMVLPSNSGNQVEIFLTSPSGRYLFLSERYWPQFDPPKPVLAQIELEKLIVLPELRVEAAAFAADETTLYLLTPTELLHWDIATASITHTTPRPVELQEKTARCLVHLGGEQFLLTTGSAFWEWSLNQPPQQRFTAGMERDCPLFAGPDWVFIYDDFGFRGELYNLQSGELLWTAADFKIHHWAVSPDGRYLAGSDSTYTYLFDFELLRQQR